MAGSCHSSPVTRHVSAFTLIEMLVVIAILGLIAGLAVPALKNLGKSDATVSAARQMLDDIGRARQLAMSQRTTVYMVFVPTSFWGNLNYNSALASSLWLGNLSSNQRAVATNLCDRQLTGYIFIGRGTVGDQPGRHNWRYLSAWQNLPEGTFIAPQKFGSPNQQVLPDITFPNNPTTIRIFGFLTNAVPFPVETSPVLFLNLPCIIFNSFGQLVALDGKTVRNDHEYIPLARGSIAPAVNVATKTYALGAPSVLEIPPGNSTNISANIIDIDPLTGRAVLQYYKMAP